MAAPKKSTLDKLTTLCTLFIFENTCPEWMTAALGAYSQVRGASCFVFIYIRLLSLLLFVFSTQFFIFSVIRPTPEYERHNCLCHPYTLGIDAIIDSVNDGRIRAIVCNKKSVKILLGKLKDMPTLMVIIYTNNMIAPGEEIDLPAAPKGVTVVSFQDFVKTLEILKPLLSSLLSRIQLPLSCTPRALLVRVLLAHL